MRLAALWRELLGHDQVSASANFFELGGHSLLATRLVALIRQDFGLELPIRAVFSQPTLRALAAALDAAEARSDVPLIERVEKDGALPLSYAQQRLWFLDQLEGASPRYNLPAALRLTGTLDRAALERAFGEIVRRHESLRTIFTVVDGEARQIIQPAPLTPLPLTDLRILPETARTAEAEALLAAEAAQPFDLGRGPLLRVRLLQLKDEEYLLLATVHHIAADGWSVGVLIQELAALYGVYERGEASPLAELPIQYADYASWQRRWLQGAERARLEDYWRRQLEGLPTLHDLPTDRPRPALQSDRGAAHRQTLGPELTEGLKRLGQQEGVTLFMTLQAAFAVLLARHSGASDIVLGTPIANRTQAELAPLIGFFVNTLVLRTDLSGTPRFLDVLRQARQTALDAYAHQALPFEQLVELMDPERSLSHHPLFQIMIALQNNEQAELSLPGLSFAPVELARTTVKFDLLLELRERPDGLEAVWEYASDLFEAATIARLAEHFHILLEGLVKNPEQTIDRLPLLSAIERQVILEDWNATAEDFRQDRCLHELFEEQAGQHPEAPALVFEDRQLTYAELNARANRLAHHLRSLGVKPDDRVAICLERSFEQIISLLAVLKAGAAYVPLDPAYPEERLAFMLEDSAPLALLTDSGIKARLTERSGGTVLIDLFADAAQWAHQPDVNIDPISLGVTPAHLAYVIYTSGSTGQPKGVMVPHAGVVNLVSWHNRQFKVNAGDRATQLAGLAFDASAWETWPYLLAGACLHLVRSELLGQPEALWQQLADDRITLAFMPTPLAELMLAAPRPEHLALRCLLTGGDRLHGHPPAGLPFELINNYGPTENSVVSTSCSVPAGGRGAAADRPAHRQHPHLSAGSAGSSRFRSASRASCISAAPVWRGAI